MNNDIQRTLGRIEGKLDGVDARLTSVEAKVSDLHEWKIKIMAVCSAITLCVTAAWQFLERKV